MLVYFSEIFYKKQCYGVFDNLKNRAFNGIVTSIFKNEKKLIKT